MVIPKPFHVIPSLLHANEFVPEPPAIKRVPFHATPLPCVVNIVAPKPVNVKPLSSEYAIVFVPDPTVTTLPIVNVVDVCLA